MANIIRNEDYENESRDAEAGAGGMRGAMEMKRGLLRQATKTEEEQVSGAAETRTHSDIIIVRRRY